VGAAQFDPEYPISIDKLLSKADALMYAQKRGAKEMLQGKNQRPSPSDFLLEQDTNLVIEKPEGIRRQWKDH
jgi:hypothetical protein